MEQKRKAKEWLKKLDMKEKKVSEAAKEAQVHKENTAVRQKKAPAVQAKEAVVSFQGKSLTRINTILLLSLKLTLMCVACVLDCILKMSWGLTGLSASMVNGSMLKKV